MEAKHQKNLLHYMRHHHATCLCRCFNHSAFHLYGGCIRL